MRKAGDAIHVAIIGLGRAGWGMHAAELRRWPELFEIVAGCGRVSARRKILADEFGAFEEWVILAGRGGHAGTGDEGFSYRRGVFELDAADVVQAIGVERSDEEARLRAGLIVRRGKTVSVDVHRWTVTRNGG